MTDVWSFPTVCQIAGLMFIILPVRKFPINGDLILGLLYVKTRMQLEIMADGGLPWQTMKLERI